jgi:hypothetical protein
MKTSEDRGASLDLLSVSVRDTAAEQRIVPPRIVTSRPRFETVLQPSARVVRTPVSANWPRVIVQTMINTVSSPSATPLRARMVWAWRGGSGKRPSARARSIASRRRLP